MKYTAYGSIPRWGGQFYWMPSDQYLFLTGEGAKMLPGEKPLKFEMHERK